MVDPGQHSDRSSRTPPATHAGGSAPCKPAWWTLHLWQIQPVRDGLVLAAAFGLVYLGYVLSVVTVPILLAMLLAYLLEPAVRFVTDRKWFTRRGFALLLIFGTLLAVIVPAGYGITVGSIQGATFARDLSVNVQKTIASVDKPEDSALEAEVSRMGKAWVDIRQHLLRLKTEHLRVVARDKGEQIDAPPDEVGATIYRIGKNAADWFQTHANSIGQQVLATSGNVAAFITSIAGSVFSLGFTLFLTGFFFYFFCTGWGGVLAFWTGMIPEKRKHRVLELLRKMDRVIAGFIRGRLTICTILAIYFAVAYWLAGVPVALLMGLLAGVLSLAPYAQWISFLLAMGLLWLGVGGSGGPLGQWEAEWWWAIAGPVIVHTVAQVLDDYILTPKIQGDTTGMDTPTILFASLAGGILAGFYGLLLAIPVAACIKILIVELLVPRIREWAQGRAKDLLPVAAAEDRSHVTTEDRA